MNDSQHPVPPVLRPMEVGEILDQTFKVYRRSWKPLAVLGLITAVPYVILQGAQMQFQVGLRGSNAMTALMMRIITAADRGDFTPLGSVLGAAIAYVLGLWLLNSWAQGAVVAVCSRTVLQQPITVGEALRLSGRRYLAFLGTGLMKAVFYILAVPALVIGGLVIFFFATVPVGLILLSAAMIFTTHVILIENVGGGWPAIKRSYMLFKSRFWPLLGLGVIFSMLAWLFGMIVQFPFGLLPTFFPSTASAWAAALAYGLSPVITTPFVMVGLTLAYYDVRVRKEGFDLEMLAHSQMAGPEEL